MARTIEQSRKIRNLEAKRDSLLESKKKTALGLATVRAELAHAKKK